MAKLDIISDTSGKSCDSSAAVASATLEDGSIRAAKDFAGNVALVTLGCAKNQVDSEVMLGSLISRGFRAVSDPAIADMIIVNTCAFLTSAVEESLDRVMEMAKYKEGGRCRSLVVAGCMVERYREDLMKSLPEVDQFISTDELLDVGRESRATTECFDKARRPYFLYDESMPRVRSTGGHSAYVKISEGCNRRCSFCIIPSIRGDMRSRPIASVVSEVKVLVQDGVREVNFVAQDLTAYGTDFEGNRGIQPELETLLRKISQSGVSADDFWLRLFYAYPIGVTESLMRTIVELPFVCNYLDMPLQHISHPVLKGMRRPLGERGTRRLIEMMKTIAPEVELRTTFIVGFPGETEGDVRELEQFVSEGFFSHVGVFTYSQEEEADSFKYDAQVSPDVASERRAVVMAAQQMVVEKRLASRIGSRAEIIVEGAHADTDMLRVGRTRWQGPETDGEVIINDADESIALEDVKVGALAEVEFTEVAGYDLVGRMIQVLKP